MKETRFGQDGRNSTNVVLFASVRWYAEPPTRRTADPFLLAFFGRPVVLPWKSSQVIQSFVVKPSGQRQPVVLLQS
jgi:hypothetical protein